MTELPTFDPEAFLAEIRETHLTDAEYNRLWPIVNGRLSAEEKAFWAKTAALNIDGSERRARRAEGQTASWKRLAYFFGVVSLVLAVILGTMGSWP